MPLFAVGRRFPADNHVRRQHDDCRVERYGLQDRCKQHGAVDTVGLPVVQALARQAQPLAFLPRVGVERIERVHVDDAGNALECLKDRLYLGVYIGVLIAHEACGRVLVGHLAQKLHNGRVVGRDKGPQVARHVFPLAAGGIIRRQRRRGARQQPDRHALVHFDLAGVQILRQHVEAGARQLVDGPHLIQEQRRLLDHDRWRRLVAPHLDGIHRLGRVALDEGSDAHTLERRRSGYRTSDKRMFLGIQQVVKRRRHAGHHGLDDDVQTCGGEAARACNLAAADKRFGIGPRLLFCLRQFLLSRACLCLRCCQLVYCCLRRGRIAGVGQLLLEAVHRLLKVINLAAQLLNPRFVVRHGRGLRTSSRRWIHLGDKSLVLVR